MKKRPLSKARLKAEKLQQLKDIRSERAVEVTEVQYQNSISCLEKNMQLKSAEFGKVLLELNQVFEDFKLFSEHYAQALNTEEYLERKEAQILTDLKKIDTTNLN